MVLHVLQKLVEDVTLAMDEEIVEDFSFGLGNQGLNNLVEISAKDGLNGLLVEEVEEFIHDRIVILGLLACLVNVFHILGANLIPLFVKGQVSFRGSSIAGPLGYVPSFPALLVIFKVVFFLVIDIDIDFRVQIVYQGLLLSASLL